jgi:hypothetical protein
MARAPITRSNPYTPTGGQFAGQTFTSERQYRNALARSRGNVSLYAEQQASKPVRSAAAHAGLKPSQRQARERALEAVALMRREGKTLGVAAQAAGTTPNTVKKYGGTALDRTRAGRYAATASDRLYRRMVMTTPAGQVEIDVIDSRTASRIARYNNAVRRYLETGDTSALREFAGKSVQAGKRRYPFITDPAALDRLARAGELSFESLYTMAA